MIKFVYRISDNLLPLVRTSIVNYTNDYFIGYMDEGDTANLRHTSLYLACELINTDNISVHSNPIAVVAKNENAGCQFWAGAATGEYHQGCAGRFGTPGLLCSRNDLSLSWF